MNKKTSVLVISLLSVNLLIVAADTAFSPNPTQSLLQEKLILGIQRDALNEVMRALQEGAIVDERVEMAALAQEELDPGIRFALDTNR